jgi:rubrerythrin
MEPMEEANDLAVFICHECEEIFMTSGDEPAECPTCGQLAEEWG